MQLIPPCCHLGVQITTAWMLMLPQFKQPSWIHKPDKNESACSALLNVVNSGSSLKMYQNCNTLQYKVFTIKTQGLWNVSTLSCGSFSGSVHNYL
jgi:hypothetical protein